MKLFLDGVKVKTLLDLYKCEHCGRCCRRERVTVNQKDIRSNRKLTSGIESHLVMGFYSMKLPCIFISEDNQCTTYINRPLACRRYPLFEKYPGNISISSCPYGDKIIKDLIEYCNLKGIPTDDNEKREVVEKWDELYRNMGVGQEESFTAVTMPISLFDGFYKWIIHDKKE